MPYYLLSERRLKELLQKEAIFMALCTDVDSKSDPFRNAIFDLCDAFQVTNIREFADRQLPYYIRKEKVCKTKE